MSAALWYEAFVLSFWNFIQWQNIYCRCATSRFQFDRPKKLSKLLGFELRRIWDILGYFYSTLSAALWYKSFVLGFWDFTQWNDIYCRCATSWFQFDRPKIVEITGFELRRIWDILGYLYNTLSATLWYEISIIGFRNFTQWLNIYCRCATLRF